MGGANAQFLSAFVNEEGKITVSAETFGAPGIIKSLSNYMPVSDTSNYAVENHVIAGDPFGNSTLGGHLGVMISYGLPVNSDGSLDVPHKRDLIAIHEMDTYSYVTQKYAPAVDPYYEKADIPSNAGSVYESQSYNLQSSLAATGVDSALTEGIVSFIAEGDTIGTGLSANASQSSVKESSMLITAATENDLYKQQKAS